MLYAPVRIGGQLEAAHAAALLVRRGHDDGARPVAEQDAGVAVGQVEEPGEQLGADDQRVPGETAHDVGVRRGIPVHEPRARGAQVERRRARGCRWPP